MKYLQWLFIYLLVINSANAESTTSSNRSRADELQKESSSFVGEPDPLDPLPLKIESLKEDDEPVLEDIRSVLNSPSTKKKENTESKSSTDLAEPKPDKVKKNKKSRSARKNGQPQGSQLLPDEADINYENKLYLLNQKYNIEPTSAETWGKITSDRPVEVFLVDKGNTLEFISKTLFGDPQFWPKIWALNHAQISNPHKIYPGQKIYFYPATHTEMPAVNLSEEPDVEPFISRKGQSIDGRQYTPQNTYFEKYGIKTRLVKKFSGPMPQPLPESIPIVRSKTYFVKRTEIQNVFDLKEMMKTEIAPPLNPYILTAQKILADYSVPKEQVNSLICQNQFVSAVTQNNLEAKPGSYILVDPLTTQNSRLKSTYIYKMIGRVEINEKLQMRIKSCLSLMNTDTMVVSEEKILNLVSPTEKIEGTPSLVESLEALSQDFFNYGQLVVISSSAEKTPAGQSFDIFSDTVGDVVGQLKVIKNAGTLSIGYLTKITQLIKINDQIRTANEFSGSNAESTLNQELMPEMNEMAPENKDFEMILE